MEKIKLTKILDPTKEETNLNVSIVSIVSCFDYQIEKETELRHTVQINYLTQDAATSPVKLSGEHVDYKWITQSEIRQHEVSESVKLVLEKTFWFLEHWTI